MGSFTNYTEKKLLDHVFGIAAFTAPTNLYGRLGLYNGGTYTGWTEAGTGGTEPPTADGYAPVVINAWDAVAVEVHPAAFTKRAYTKNTNAVEWGPSVTNPWGTDNLRFGALADAATGGNVLAHYDLVTTDAHPVVDNQLLTLAAGEMKWYQETPQTSGSSFAFRIFSIYLMQKLLEHFFGIAPYTPPASLYLGLMQDMAVAYKNEPASWTERAGGNYARVNVTGIWNAAVTAGDGRGMIDNNAAINFAVAAPGETFPINGWALAARLDKLALFDAATGGNVLMWFQGGLPNIPTGDRLVLPANYLQAYLN